MKAGGGEKIDWQTWPGVRRSLRGAESVKEYKRTVGLYLHRPRGSFVTLSVEMINQLGFLTNILELQLSVNLSRTTPWSYTSQWLDELLQTQSFLYLIPWIIVLSPNKTVC